MLCMVSHPRRPLSGHITCYLNRTYHVLPTASLPTLAKNARMGHPRLEWRTRTIIKGGRPAKKFSGIENLLFFSHFFSWLDQYHQHYSWRKLHSPTSSQTLQLQICSLLLRFAPSAMAYLVYYYEQ